MNNSRILLILFAVAFLAIQVISYMGGISKHQERTVKLEKQLVQFETKGAYIDLKSDPAVKLREEKARFKAETLSFVLKVLVISGATAFVYALIKRERKQRDG
ncbi:hypothetical protein [Pelotomaculum propionicicum]|uniref:Uncharacterized protein n=1 Tax=Pelotomaculum propionicicum TaxID=258475 RepID=A0A4Y7RUB2_9FIRM|nr:hypothetical protein [Pelotomaculum propionicicum]NLI14137.1 hypothetical protein [Peptococcaceae bacterium]TEB12360.1 hypothetical protein Pmgp_00977 [Pelotomaculum propionicicum]